VTILNVVLLGSVLAPVIIIMPLLVIIFGVVYRGWWSFEFFDERFWPAVEMHPILSKMIPRVDQQRATAVCQHWKDRLVFSVLSWFEISCFIICSRSIQSIFCELLDGEYRLASDRSVLCGQDSRAWVFHIVGYSFFLNCLSRRVAPGTHAW
jgi:hypothetical protein